MDANSVSKLRIVLAFCLTFHTDQYLNQYFSTYSWTTYIFFLLGSDLNNFADDNTVAAVAETIQDLINSLEVKTSNIIEWMKDNDMIANPNKFKAKTY